MIKFKGSGNVVPSHEVMRQSVVLADKIEASYKSRGRELPILGFIARSGWYIGPIIMDRLGISAAEVLNINTEKTSDDIDIALSKRFRHGQIPNKRLVKQKRVLIVDAACRSGDTLMYASMLIDRLGPLSLKTAVVFDSIPGTDEERRLNPNYSATNDKSLGYVTLPWEYEEFLALEQDKPALPIVIDEEQNGGML